MITTSPRYHAFCFSQAIERKLSSLDDAGPEAMSPRWLDARTTRNFAMAVSYRAGSVSPLGTPVPLVEKETHSARVVAEIANPDGNWRPGSLVQAVVAIEERAVALAAPASAVQTIGKTRVVFVRTQDGFERRPVTLGDGDDRLFEVLSGVREGETIAVSNTFALKAEFLKSLAED
jgi:hypothetical protein